MVKELECRSFSVCSYFKKILMTLPYTGFLYSKLYYIVMSVLCVIVVFDMNCCADFLAQDSLAKELFNLNETIPG